MDLASPVVGMAGINTRTRSYMAGRRPFATGPGLASRRARGWHSREFECASTTGPTRYFRPAEFVPRDRSLPPGLAGLLAGLMFVGHGVPVCPRYVPTVRSVPLSLAILLSGAIWQVLVHPSRPTARMDQLHPAIQAIPTFGICGECYHDRTGYKPAKPKYSSELNGTDGPDR